MASAAGDVLLDGQLMSRAMARIAVDDRGFLHGDGAFETLRVYHGVPFLLEEHLARLFASLRALQIELAWNRLHLQAQVRLLLEHEAPLPADARLRITVTRGSEAATTHAPTVLITVDPYEPPANEVYERGVTVIVAKQPRVPHPLHRVKSTSYAANLWLRREAMAAGAQDALQFSTEGRLTEGSYTNVFIVDDAGVLRTPQSAEGCLKGVTRNAVLTIATESQMPWQEGGIDRAALEAAREVFLTGSLVEILPVRQIDTRIVGDGHPGPRTRALHIAYRTFVERATGRGPQTTPEGN